MKQMQQDNGDVQKLQLNLKNASLKIRLIKNIRNLIRKIKNQVKNIIKGKNQKKIKRKKSTNCRCYNCGEK